MTWTGIATTTRYRRPLALLGLALALLIPTAAGATSLLLIPSQSAQPYLQVVDRLLHELQPADLNVDVRPAAAIRREQLQHYQLLVTIGTSALETIQKLESTAPVLALMIPRHSFERLTATELAQRARQRGQLSAIFLEQPYWRQLQLARSLSADGRVLGALLGPHAHNDDSQLRRAVLHHGWQPRLQPLAEDDNPLAVIGDLVAASDLLLAIPDRADFNRNTAKWLLMLSLRQGIPLIGYSQRYVDAGAVAAVFSGADSIAAEGASWVVRWQRQGAQQLPAAAPPHRFEVSFNADIAHRLGIELPARTQLNEILLEESLP